MAANKAMADRALRVLAAAKRDWSEKPVENTPDYLEHDLIFLGLTGMIDPVRPEVKAAIEECRSAGIRAVMITGDHKDTAVAIAKELGIITDASQAITGAELDAIRFLMMIFWRQLKNTASMPAFSPNIKPVS